VLSCPLFFSDFLPEALACWLALLSVSQHGRAFSFQPLGGARIFLLCVWWWRLLYVSQQLDMARRSGFPRPSGFSRRGTAPIWANLLAVHAQLSGAWPSCHPVLTLCAGVLRHGRSLLALPRCGWFRVLQSQSSRWQPSLPSCRRGRCALLGPRPRGRAPRLLAAPLWPRLVAALLAVNLLGLHADGVSPSGPPRSPAGVLVATEWYRVLHCTLGWTRRMVARCRVLADGGADTRVT
jgi:hypothetical protein